jgi:hypothetical protein
LSGNTESEEVDDGFDATVGAGRFGSTRPDTIAEIGSAARSKDRNVEAGEEVPAEMASRGSRKSSYPNSPIYARSVSASHEARAKETHGEAAGAPVHADPKAMKLSPSSQARKSASMADVFAGPCA